MAYPDGMQFQSSDTRSPYYQANAMQNYFKEVVEADIRTSEKIREEIKNTEARVNALLSRVNDRAAFDDEEIGCLFNALVEALPGRRVLEQRAG